MATTNLSHVVVLASEYVEVDREAVVAARLQEQLEVRRHVAHERRAALEAALAQAVGAVPSVSLDVLLTLGIKYGAAQRIIDRSEDV